ncbi:class IV lanthionine synthetase LanL [Streptomyces sp. SAT1]|uniref:class IV lanthionine synthetase LanL n=1 Tax=Streptomyces sp. SAT1 TaxID=1849967 RepID=UPI0009A0F38E
MTSDIVDQVSGHPPRADRPAPPFDPVALLTPFTQGRATGGRAWRITRDDLWCQAEPVGGELPGQGWKIHVSATPAGAAEILRKVAGILIPLDIAFKVAASAERVRELVSRQYDRASAGKFITVYPDGGRDLAALAAELHEATARLPGPRILSDRPFRPGSLVHYRYGGFRAAPVLGDNGVYRPTVEDAAGRRVPDVREPWYTPPAGIPDPFEEAAAAGRTPDADRSARTAAPPQASAARPARPPSVVIGDRFVVRRALRHSTKGGVFRATDRLTGAEVVVKQGRAHIDATPLGTDVRDLLRNEGEMLDLLAPLGLAPRKVAFLPEDGHVFLVEEFLEGVPLRLWNLRARSGGAAPPWEAVLDLARRLTDVLARVHAHGVVLRDLTPDNVFVAPDGALRLVDLELATRAGHPAPGGGTRGYGAPEQLDPRPGRRALPAPAADLYALGAVLFLLATGTEPLLAPDAPPVRSARVRLAGRLAAVARHSATARRLAPLVLGLLHEEPERRWSLRRARAFLTDGPAAHPAGPRPVRAPHGPAATPGADAERLLRDGLRHLLDTLRPEDRERLWPAEGFAATTDPCNVYYGSAGLLGVLASAARTRPGDERLRAAVRTVAHRTLRRAAREPRLLPGLHFGRSGTAWALLDAGLLLGDGELVAAARETALRVPVTGPVPDVVHGTAGAGLAQAYFLARTGDERFRERIARCAEGILAAAADGPAGPRWTVPSEDGPAARPVVHHGFAHGTAGIGTFLLEAARATGEDRYLEAAVRAGDALTAAAVEDRGALRWTAGPDDTVPLANWCSGASGVGVLLLRLWQATGEDRYLEAARGAAEAVHADRWLLPPSSCHGVAGNAELLLDLADATGEDRHRLRAHDAVEAVLSRTALRGGLLLPADDTLREVSTGHHTGLGGVLGFLLRLLHGGPRLWLPDPSWAAPSTAVRAPGRGPCDAPPPPGETGALTRGDRR